MAAYSTSMHTIGLQCPVWYNMGGGKRQTDRVIEYDIYVIVLVG